MILTPNMPGVAKHLWTGGASLIPCKMTIGVRVSRGTATLVFSDLQTAIPYHYICCITLSPDRMNFGKGWHENMTTINKDKIDHERMMVLRSLPREIKEQITGEEARAFLYKEELPETLLKKLEGYTLEEAPCPEPDENVQEVD